MAKLPPNVDIRMSNGRNMAEKYSCLTCENPATEYCLWHDHNIMLPETATHIARINKRLDKIDRWTSQLLFRSGVFTLEESQDSGSEGSQYNYDDNMIDTIVMSLTELDRPFSHVDWRHYIDRARPVHVPFEDMLKLLLKGDGCLYEDTPHLHLYDDRKQVVTTKPLTSQVAAVAQLARHINRALKPGELRTIGAYSGVGKSVFAGLPVHVKGADGNTYEGTGQVNYADTSEKEIMNHIYELTVNQDAQEGLIDGDFDHIVVIARGKHHARGLASEYQLVSANESVEVAPAAHRQRERWLDPEQTSCTLIGDSAHWVGARVVLAEGVIQ